MKLGLMVCAAHLIGAASVLWAADEPGKPAAAPEPMIKLSPGSAKLVGEPAVKEFPAMNAAVATVKAADYAPDGGYSKNQAGVDKAYAAMMKGGFDKLMKWSHASGTWPSGPAFTQLFENPSSVDPAQLRAKIAFPVPAEAKAAEGVTVEEIPAMSAATLQYQGPYDTGNNAWSALMEWTAKNGYETAGAPMEVYLKGPMDVKDANEYLTEIRIPVRKTEMKEAEEAPAPKK